MTAPIATDGFWTRLKGCFGNSPEGAGANILSPDNFIKSGCDPGYWVGDEIETLSSMMHFQSATPQGLGRMNRLEFEIHFNTILEGSLTRVNVWAFNNSGENFNHYVELSVPPNSGGISHILTMDAPSAIEDSDHYFVTVNIDQDGLGNVTDSTPWRLSAIRPTWVS